MSLLRRLLDLLPRRPLGARGERAAARCLRAKRYRILARNLRSAVGEIDILAEAPDGRTIVVVEVKSGMGGTIAPEVHVNRAKQAKLASLALLLLRRRGMADRPIRFDVVGVDFVPGQPPVIRHHEHAFESRW